MTKTTGEMFSLGQLTPRWAGYYMDTDYKIYSTKRSVTPTLLAGSSTISGRYYTLSGSAYRVHRILREVKSSYEWKCFLNDLHEQAKAVRAAKSDKVATVAGEPADRQWAHDTRHGLAEKGWVIAAVYKAAGNNSPLVLGSDPKIHLTEESVKAEMERLATVFKGDTFVALKITHEVVSDGINWR